MSDEELNISFIALCEMYIAYRRSKTTKNQQQPKTKRRWRKRPINQDWAEHGYQRQVFRKIRDMDEEQLFIHTRMTRPVFELLLKLVGNALRKPKQSISAEQRLSLTLFYLGHGEAFQCLAGSYKLGRTTVRNIVLETCEVLWRLLSPVYVSEPTQSQYSDIAKDFFELWNIPNCVGAIDGKHIAIKCPANSGSMFHNNKKVSSIVLMAVCDAKHTFTSVSIDSYGGQSNGGVFQNCPFGQALMANTVPLPPDAPLSLQSRQPFPHYFVGNVAFPLKNNLMRPYSGGSLNRTKRIFNFRLSRAWRVIENSLGILTSRWRVLRNAVECNPTNTEKITLACIALHNFVMRNDQQRWYCPEHYVDWEGADNEVHDGEWRHELNTLRPMTSAVRRGPASAFPLRDKLADYFVCEGAVSFQDTVDATINGPHNELIDPTLVAEEDVKIKCITF